MPKTSQEAGAAAVAGMDLEGPSGQGASSRYFGLCSARGPDRRKGHPVIAREVYLPMRTITGQSTILRPRHRREGHGAGHGAASFELKTNKGADS